VREVDDTSGHVARRKHLCELDRCQRLRLRCERDDGVAADDGGCDARDEAEQRRLVRGDDPHDTRGLGHGEVEVGAGDRVRRPEHLRELVREARVPDPAVDGALDLVAAPPSAANFVDARLHHLRDAVEHLTAVVGRHARPPRLRSSRGDDRVAQILARRARDVLPLRLVRASRLRTREGTPDEQLVRLLDRQALIASG
jgi:hypothetical protein